MDNNPSNKLGANKMKGKAKLKAAMKEHKKEGILTKKEDKIHTMEDKLHSKLKKVHKKEGKMMKGCK